MAGTEELILGCHWDNLDTFDPKILAINDCQHGRDSVDRLYWPWYWDGSRLAGDDHGTTANITTSGTKWGLPSCVDLSAVGENRWVTRHFSNVFGRPADVRIYSISCWVKPTYSGTPVNSIEFMGVGAQSISAGSYNTGQLFHSRVDGKLKWLQWSESHGSIAGITASDNPWSPVSGQWYYLEFCFDYVNGNQYLFIDGELVGTSGIIRTGINGFQREDIIVGAHANVDSLYPAEGPFYSSHYVQEITLYDGIWHTASYDVVDRPMLERFQDFGNPYHLDYARDLPEGDEYKLTPFGFGGWIKNDVGISEADPKFDANLETVNPPYFPALVYFGEGLVDSLGSEGTIEYFFRQNGSPTFADEQEHFRIRWGDPWLDSGYNTNAIYCYQYINGNLRVVINHSGSVSAVTLDAVNPFTPGQWHHVEIAFKIDGAVRQGYLFIDGALVDSQDTTGSPARTTGCLALYIGDNEVGNGSYADFGMDEFLIWETVKHTSVFIPRTEPLRFVDPDPPVPLPPNILPAGITYPQKMYEQLEGVVTTFLGYRPTSEELEDFPFLVYNFIIKSLRLQDGLRGSAKFLLKRFLMGPQEVWVQMYRRTGELYNLYDPEAIDAEYLPGLRRLVGFGSDLDALFSIASEIETRRIIAGAVNFWRQRWLDSGVVAAIRLVTGNRYKVRDYFDFRFVIGETMILEDLENVDPNMIHVNTLNRFQQATDGVSRFGGNPTWFYSASAAFAYDDIGGYIVVTGSDHSDGIYKILSLIDGNTVTVDPPFPSPQEPPFPSPQGTSLTWFSGFPYDEYLSEIRIVDEGTGQGELNRELLKALLEIQRPSSERFNVVYVDFMDKFTTPYDSGQWEEITGGGALVQFLVDEGRLTLEDDGTSAGIITNRPTAADWKDYTLKFKAAVASDPGYVFVFFCLQDTQNTFALEIGYDGFGSGYVRLIQTVSGTPTYLTGQIPFLSLNPETYWTYTLEVFDLDPNLNIRLLIDGNLITDVTVASTFRSGNIGFVTLLGTTLWVSEVELWQYPLEIDRVGPNP